MRRPLPSLAVTLLVLGTLGCGQNEVTRTRIPKDTPPPAPMPMAGMQGDVPMPEAPQPGAALAWTLPKGWTESRPGGMRVATLVPSGPGKVDVSVTRLSGAAGGELANVNRWRGQIGLPPVDEAGLAPLRKALKAPAGPVAVFDFTSEGQARTRMVVGLLSTPDGSTWFLKMVGDADAVGPLRPEFLRLLESLRLA